MSEPIFVCPPKVKSISRRRFRQYTPTFTHYELTPVESCYFAALCEGLRLIDEKSGGLATTVRLPEHYGTALQQFVCNKGKIIARACGIEFEKNGVQL